MDFFDRTKELCKQNDYTLSTLLQSLGINYETYKSAKRLGNLPRADEAVKIAKALNTTVEYLVTGKDIRPDPNTIIKDYLESLLRSL